MALGPAFDEALAFDDAQLHPPHAWPRGTAEWTNFGPVLKLMWREGDAQCFAFNGFARLKFGVALVLEASKPYHGSGAFFSWTISPPLPTFLYNSSRLLLLVTSGEVQACCLVHALQHAPRACSLFYYEVISALTLIVLPFFYSVRHPPRSGTVDVSAAGGDIWQVVYAHRECEVLDLSTMSNVHVKFDGVMGVDGASGLRCWYRPVALCPVYPRIISMIYRR